MIRHSFKVMRKNRVQFILIFLMSMISITVLIGIKGSALTIENTRSYYFKGHTYDRLDYLTEKTSKSTIGENQKERLVYDSMINNKIIRVNVLADPEQYTYDSDGVDLGTYNVGLDYKYAQENKIEPHDIVKINYNNEEYEFIIDMLIYSPEYTNFLPFNSQIVQDRINTGYLYIDEKEWNNTIGELRGNQIVTINDKIGSTDNEFKSKYYQKFSEGITENTLKAKVDQIMSISLIFPLLLFFVTLLIVYTTIKRLLYSQIKNVGIFRSMGISRKKVFLYGVAPFLITILIGSFTGSIIGGIVVPRILMNTMSKLFSFPRFYYAIEISDLFIGVSIMLLITIFTYWHGVKKLYKGNIPMILKGNTGVKSIKKILIKNRRISETYKVIARSLYANSSRCFIATFGVMLSIGLVISALGLRDTMNNLLSDTYQEIYTYASKHYISDVGNIEIIQGDEFFYENIHFIEMDDVSAVNILGIESNTKFVTLHNEKSEIVFPKNEKIVISRKLAEKFNVSKDDKIFIDFLPGKEFIVGDIAIVPVGQSIFVDVENIPSNQYNGIFSEKDIQGYSDVSERTLSKEEEVKSFNIFMQSMIGIVYLMIFAAILVLFAILFNLGILSFIEKRKSFSLFLLQGVNRKAAFIVVSGEYVLSVLIGSIFAIPMGIFLHRTVFLKGFGEHLDVTLFLSTNSILVSMLIGSLITYIVLQYIRSRSKKLNLATILKEE